MATDWYVSGLSAGGVGTAISPWTFAEMITAINDATVSAGDTCWMKSDGTYTTAGASISVAGGAYQAKRIFGYTLNIGDGGMATIQRSGGAGVLLDWDAAYWSFANLIIDGQDAGTINLQTNATSAKYRIETHSAGTQGGKSGAWVNSYSHDNGDYGFYLPTTALNCIAVNNGDDGFNAAEICCVNCISKGNTDANYYSARGGYINCISDGGTKNGFEMVFGNVLANCIAINGPVGGDAVAFLNASAGRASNIARNIVFFNNDSNSNKLAFIDTYSVVDPQFKDPDNLDYTRTGTNLDDLGFSEIGMVTAADYNIDIGPDQKGSADYPAEADVVDGVVFDSGNLEGDFEYPAESEVKDGVGFGSLGTEFDGDVELPAEADVKSGTGYGSGGTEFEGELVISRVESPIDLKVQDDRVVLEVTDE